MTVAASRRLAATMSRSCISGNLGIGCQIQNILKSDRLDPAVRIGLQVNGDVGEKTYLSLAEEVIRFCQHQGEDERPAPPVRPSSIGRREAVESFVGSKRCSKAHECEENALGDLLRLLRGPAPDFGASATASTSARENRAYSRKGSASAARDAARSADNDHHLCGSRDKPVGSSSRACRRQRFHCRSLWLS